MARPDFYDIEAVGEPMDVDGKTQPLVLVDQGLAMTVVGGRHRPLQRHDELVVGHRADAAFDGRNARLEGPPCLRREAALPRGELRREKGQILAAFGLGQITAGLGRTAAGNRENQEKPTQPRAGPRASLTMDRPS